MVEVRYTGVSMQPHSPIWIDPVSSPAPFTTAVPAASGRLTRVSSGPGTITVTPVRATPRPAGGARPAPPKGPRPTGTPPPPPLASLRPPPRAPGPRPRPVD